MKIPQGVKDTLKAALDGYRGDDLYRARRSFRGLSQEEMNEEHGASGRTRQEWLSDYEQHDADCQAALAFLEAH